MEMHATRTLAADRATVWAALNDAETLKACIPGCEELTGTPEEGFEAVVKQKVGPVKATFKGAVTLSDVVPGTSYTISGEGKGGVAGFAKGAAQVALSRRRGRRHEPALRRRGQGRRQDRATGLPPDRQLRPQDGRPVLRTLRGPCGPAAPLMAPGKSRTPPRTTGKVRPAPG
jgi:uncharacterized protein YndB with AHSA1/START domain